MKIIGIALLAVMSVMCGCYASDGLKKRAAALKSFRTMVESIRLMVRYEALEVSDIVRRLSDDGALRGLDFICLLKSYMDEDNVTPFSKLWSKAADNGCESFNEEDMELIKRTGNVLGSCDCEGQLSALSSIMAQADRLIAEADEQYKSKGRLYRSLGAAAGALIAIVIV